MFFERYSFDSTMHIVGIKNWFLPKPHLFDSIMKIVGNQTNVVFS